MATKKPGKNKFLQSLVNKYAKRKIATKSGAMAKLKMVARGKKKSQDSLRKV